MDFLKKSAEPLKLGKFVKLFHALGYLTMCRSLWLASISSTYLHAAFLCEWQKSRFSLVAMCQKKLWRFSVLTVQLFSANCWQLCTFRLKSLWNWPLGLGVNSASYIGHSRQPYCMERAWKVCQKMSFIKFSIGLFKMTQFPGCNNYFYKI